MALAIRPAGPERIADVESILLDAVNWMDATGKSQWTREAVSWTRLSRYFAAEDFWIAEVDGEAAGCMALVERDPTFWPELAPGEALFVHKLAVTRAHAGESVADALIRHAKRECVRRGVASLRLDAHAERAKVRALYERLGFSCVREALLWGRYQAAFYAWRAPRVYRALETDAPDWMALVMAQRDGFPGLVEADYRATLMKNIARGTALCAKTEDEMAGVLLFSPKLRCLSCMAVAPAWRRLGVGSALAREMLARMPGCGDVSVTTFREGDPKGAAPRTLYRGLGFEPAELTEEFGYPVQRFVFRARHG